MKFWIVQAGEPVAGLAGETRMGRCNHLASQLTARGHEVVWWTSAYSHFHKRFLFDADKDIDIAGHCRARVLHSKPGYSRNISLARLIQQKRLAARFAKQSNREPPPDLIYTCVPIPELCTASSAAAARMQRPLVVDIRDPWPDVYLLAVPRRLRGLLRAMLTLEYRRMARILARSSGIVAVSPSYLRWGLSLAGRPAAQADGVFPIGALPPNGIVTLRGAEKLRQIGICPTSTKAVFSGSLGRTYDLRTVIGAARHLNLRAMNIQIVIAGSGPDEAALRDAARDCGNVVFTGWLDQSLLSELLLSCHIGLAAYAVDATQSLPNKVFDYMAVGLPLVASLKGETAELLDQEKIGVSYAAGSVTDLADALEHLHCHPDLRACMADRARAVFASRFTANTIYPRLAAHLEGLASRLSVAT